VCFPILRAADAPGFAPHLAPVRRAA
jgi:hypothetical protein